MHSPVTSDSKNYRHTFYGILNAQGEFWTPIPFDSEAKAQQHIIDFWGRQSEQRDKCLRTHKIVPVRIRLETIETEDASQ